MNILTKISNSIASLSTLTIAFIFATMFFLITNVATLLSSNLYDLFSTALRSITPNSWHANSYSNKYNSKNKEYEKLKKNHSANKNKYDQLSNDFKKKSKEYESMKKARNSLSEKNTKLLDQNRDLDYKNKSMTTELETFKAKQQKLYKTKNHIKETSKRIASRARKNVLVNVSSLPAESIPLIGAGAAYAATAMDVYDACQTMKDMNSMLLALELDVNSSDEDHICGYNITDSKLSKEMKNYQHNFGGWIDHIKRQSEVSWNETQKTIGGTIHVMKKSSESRYRELQKDIGGTIDIIINH